MGKGTKRCNLSFFDILRSCLFGHCSSLSELKTKKLSIERDLHPFY